VAINSDNNPQGYNAMRKTLETAILLESNPAEALKMLLYFNYYTKDKDITQIGRKLRVRVMKHDSKDKNIVSRFFEHEGYTVVIAELIGSPPKGSYIEIFNPYSQLIIHDGRAIRSNNDAVSEIRRCLQELGTYAQCDRYYERIYFENTTINPLISIPALNEVVK